MPFKNPFLQPGKISFRISFITILLFLAAQQLRAQKTESFTIPLPENKISNSLYDRISLVDIRADTNDFGIVQKGAFNRKEKVVLEVPFATQFSNVVNALVDNTAQHGELVLLLRHLRFAEMTGSFSEKGYFHFRAMLLTKVADKYATVADIDTVVVVSSMDVTKALFRAGSKNLLLFIQSNLTKKPPAAENAYSLYEITSIDSVEKSKLPLYTAAHYKNGAYKTFESFVNQQPENEDIKFDYFKNGELQYVLLKNKKGKFDATVVSEWYAFCHEDKLYISTFHGVYPLEHRDNDFYFIGKAKVQASSGEVLTAGLFFGLIGALAASSGSTGVFELKLDHKSGGFIQVKEAKAKDIRH